MDGRHGSVDGRDDGKRGLHVCVHAHTCTRVCMCVHVYI